MKICERCNKEHNGTFGSGRFCSRSCANTQTHSEETKRKISDSVINSEIFKIKNKEGNIKRYNNGINKKNHSIYKTCPICQNSFFGWTIFCSRKCFEYDILHGYIFSKKPKTGGYHPGSGRGKSGWYRGIFCNSTYELAWVIYNLEHSISFERNHNSFFYIHEGKQYRYYPDFIQNGEYIEIKGFLRSNDKSKFEQFPGQLKILYEKDIKEHIEYCKQKYGYHFEELYEGNPHNIKTNKCLVCGNPCQFKYCSRSCSGKYLRKQIGTPTQS
jgi:hypothetical protein